MKRNMDIHGTLLGPWCLPLAISNKHVQKRACPHGTCNNAVNTMCVGNQAYQTSSGKPHFSSSSSAKRPENTGEFNL